MVKVSSSPNNASNHIQWQVIRKNSCFLKRQRGIQKLFSTERFNLKNVNSLRYNGLVNKKAIDIRVGKDNKSITLTLKNKKHVNKPVKVENSVVLSKDSRHTLKVVKNVVHKYKPGKSRIAKKKASQILRSFKVAKPKTAKNA